MRRNTTRSRFRFWLTVLTGLLILYFTAGYLLFISAGYHCDNCSDQITIHFLHGYYPEKDCPDQHRTVGGLLGGHIEMEIDSFVYGFEFENRQNIHVFSRQSPSGFNSRFTRKVRADWERETIPEKVTSIHIPVNEVQKSALLDRLNTYHQHAPYDYAVLGMRCASTTYEILADAGIVPEKYRIQYILNAFYPRQLRKRMLVWASGNGLDISRKNGIDCRVWE